MSKHSIHCRTHGGAPVSLDHEDCTCGAVLRMAKAAIVALELVVRSLKREADPPPPPREKDDD